MTDTPELTRLRVLLCFDPSNRSECTVTGIARTLGMEKYSVSRVLKYFNQQGIIDTTDSRHPKLTAKGEEEEAFYRERVHTLVNHLLYEGVDLENARSDALSMALYNSEQSMAAIRATEESYRIKYEFRDRSKFGGAVLAKRMRDGTYQFPFMLYREQSLNGDNYAPDNKRFLHPATVTVREDQGRVQLLATDNGEDTVREIRYFDSGRFVTAEKNAGIFCLPLESFNFINLEGGSSEVFHGSLPIRIFHVNAETEQDYSPVILTLFL